MNYLISGLLIAVGLINFYPVVGVLSEERLTELYGVTFDCGDCGDRGDRGDRGDLILLMRHRAVLFGLLGSFVIFSAFKPRLQLSACVVGLISMLAFIVLAGLEGEPGPALRKIVIVDAVASIVLGAVLLLRWRRDVG